MEAGLLFESVSSITNGCLNELVLPCCTDVQELHHVHTEGWRVGEETFPFPRPLLDAFQGSVLADSVGFGIKQTWVLVPACN